MKKRLFSLCVALLLTLASCAPTTEPSPAPVPTIAPTVEPTPEPTPAPPQDSVVTLSFGGDILCHTPVFTAAAKGNGAYDFGAFLQYGMADFFHADFNFANMENPVDVYGENEKISSYPAFNAPREIGDFALSLGIDTVAFCNNHAYDKGYAGLCTTVDNLKERGLSVAGAYQSEEEFNTPDIREIGGVKIGLLCYTSLVNSRFGVSNGELINTLEPNSLRTFVQRDASAEAMCGEIQALREAGAELVIVYLHWGSEYKNSPSATQKSIAHALCEGGADLIVGGHSHCVQPMERYVREDGKESLIFYSLGNLFADQTGLSKEKYGSDIAKTNYGVKVNVTVTKDALTGDVSITGGDYEPTCLLRRKVNGQNEYFYLASGRYATKETADPLFPNDAIYQKCVDAYRHVTGILGQDVLPVHLYEEENLT